MIYYYLTSLILPYKNLLLYIVVKIKVNRNKNIFFLNLKVNNSYKAKWVMLSNNISFVLTNDILNIFYSPIIFFNFRIIEKDK